MKRILIYALVLLMAFSGVPAWGEESVQDSGKTGINDAANGEELMVVNATPLSGNFFARMWGNSTTDDDVKFLLQGYNLIEWNDEAVAFVVDPTVVSGFVVTANPSGDRTYTMELYDDLFYSDGTQITAWDYAFTILLSISSQVEEIGGSPVHMEYIKGYQDYVDGTADSLAGVRVYSDLTFAITVDHEYLPFFYELGLLNCRPFPIHVIAPGCSVRDAGEGVFIDGPFTADLLRETILDETTGYLSHPAVTSGPYRLVSYDGSQAEFEINKYYKGNSDSVKPTIPRLIFRTAEKTEMVSLLASGEVGLLNKVVDADQVEEGLALSGSTFNMTQYYRTGLAFIAFCCERPAVSSQAVRQALSYCFDKDAATSDTVNSFGLRVDGYYGLGQWMYQALSGAVAYPVKEPASGASEKERQDYEDELKAWEGLTMDAIPRYDPDTNEAIRLLESDGWTLNRNGEPFDPETDDVRCKIVDGELTALDLTMICPEENGFSDLLLDAFKGIDEVGIKLTIVNLPMQEVLHYYYREAERDFDLIFMASNFEYVFDPSIIFMPDGDEANPYNFSAINDEELFEKAVDMRLTEPGDMLGYVTKWIDFQTRLQTVAPIISIYSNMYYDFYSSALQDYHPESNISWGQAIVYATLSDVAE